MYLTSITGGKFVEDSVYVSIIYNSDLNEAIAIMTPDANETAKIASTLEFKDK